MKRIQDRKNRNPDRPIPGCLGKMVNLFDLNTSIGGNRLLTDKPYHDGSSFSRRQSDASRTSLVDGQMDDRVIIPDLRKSPSNRKSNGTPIKMLIAHEMSKEEDSKQSPSNLVAKLMGLDALPQGKSQTRESRSQSGSFEFLQQEHGFMDTKAKHEHGEYKDVYGIWKQSSKQETQNDRKMALVREKFMEAKRLSTDEKLRQSKQFQDALEVLSSNKELFLKFLQEPNSLLSQNLYSLQSVPPPPDSKRITVLRPSKLVDIHKKNENQQMGSLNLCDKNHKTNSESLSSPDCCDIDDNPTPTHPTRIVVLKPSSMRPHNTKNVASPLRTSNNDEFDVGPEENCDNPSGLRRDETLLSSVFSNGYIGDESSFSKSEIDYAEGTLSDPEVVSPPSRHSWDYINRFDSPYYTSSYSPESSVCREAKKRLSERWAMMASNKNVLEQRQIQRSSSTLGDMLALSDFKKSLKPEDPSGPKPEDADNTPGNLLRSKSVPMSAGSGLGAEVSGSLNGKADAMKEKLVKSSSFKGRVSSLFFSKNKKSSKEKFDQSKDEAQSARFPRNIGNDGPQCSNDTVEEESCTRLTQGIILPEVGFSFTKHEVAGNPSENQDQPSPISVLEPQFEDYDHTTDSSRNAKLNRHGIEPMKYNLIDKSPPIGSISRTLSWDDSALGSTTPYAGQPSSTPFNAEEERQECLFYLQTLLSASALDNVRSNSFLAKWHSPESPLDPSLKDKYINPTPIQSKQRHHQRSLTKLIFNCANEALMDIANHGPCTGYHNSFSDDRLLVDRVWAHMREWMPGEERCGDAADDMGGMVVERVVRREVVGRGWVEQLRMEIDKTRKEIEGKLLDELVLESVWELTGRV